jgi:hypothetical protein
MNSFFNLKCLKSTLRALGNKNLFKYLLMLVRISIIFILESVSSLKVNYNLQIRDCGVLGCLLHE